MSVRRIVKDWIRKALPWTPELVQHVFEQCRWQLARLRCEEWYREQAAVREFFRRAMYAIMFNGISGDYAEFGCWSAVTFRMAYWESRQIGFNIRLWAFDSFCGLPPRQCSEDEHPMWTEGDMAMTLEEFHRKLALHGVPRSAYQAVPGFYNETLTQSGMHPSLPSDIAIAYVDCDLYSSTVDVLRFLLPRLKHGMIVAFDDYFCCSDTRLSGERRAYIEYLECHPDWLFLPYMQFGWAGMSFLVESRKNSCVKGAGQPGL
jgi:hypothetical protein